MDGKMIAALLSVFALAGAAFAFGGWGGKGGGGEFGGGCPCAGANNTTAITNETRISFMKAMHEGDFAAVESLSEEYGIGKGIVAQGEEIFTLRQQMREAMDSGNYEEALALQDEMGEARKARMEELRESAIENGMGKMRGAGRMAQGEAGENGFGGMRNRGMGEGCPLADDDGAE